MINEILLLDKKHEDAARLIYDRVKPEFHDKYIITISGEVETGKAEVAHLLGRMFKKDGLMVKILHMDNYYKIPPRERTRWRKEHGIESIGYDEYDWETIEKNITSFREEKEDVLPCVDLFTGQIDRLSTDFTGIQLLIIEGLYSIKVKESDLKVFVEMTYKETMQEQLASGKEELDEFRMQILEQEHKVVQSLKPLADFYIDYSTGREIFHL
jgi:uridine kinase